MKRLTETERLKLLDDLALCEEGVVFTPQAVKTLILRLLELPDTTERSEGTYLRGGRL